MCFGAGYVAVAGSRSPRRTSARMPSADLAAKTRSTTPASASAAPTAAVAMPQPCTEDNAAVLVAVPAAVPAAATAEEKDLPAFAMACPATRAVPPRYPSKIPVVILSSTRVETRRQRLSRTAILGSGRDGFLEIRASASNAEPARSTATTSSGTP